MNYCEYLRSKIIQCENEIRKISDENLLKFWESARKGFELRLENSTIEGLEKVVR